MSDEEVVREHLERVYPVDEWPEVYEALSRILSDRDSLRAALERIRDADYRGNPTPESDIARQALTSSKKEKG